jgi:MOSC domain-containing protein YiiM
MPTASGLAQTLGVSQPAMTVERIYLASQPGEPQIQVRSVSVILGAGIQGDRYFGAKGEPGQNITLVEAEEIEAFNSETGLGLDLSCTRRNLVMRGVRLAELVGKEFSVGEVRMRGVELCEPCLGFGERLASASLPRAAVVKRFVHRAGIRADILCSGTIVVGASWSER